MDIEPPVGLPTMSNRAKRVLIALVGIVVLAILWFQFVGVYVDWLWFGEVGFREVFVTRAVTRVVLFVIAGLGGGGLVFVSLRLAYRSRPVVRAHQRRRPARALSGDHQHPSEAVRARRFRSGRVDLRFVRPIGLGHGAALAARRRLRDGGSAVRPGRRLLRVHPADDPAGARLAGGPHRAICVVAVAVVQYLFGGIRFSGPGRMITAEAVRQLSVLLAAFLLVNAVQYWYDRYQLLFSNRGGTFTGASYTDINAVLPAKLILMLIAAICAVGFVVGAVTRSIRLPAIALGLLVLSGVLIGGVWPLVLQQVVVNPNGINREPQFIARSIDATRTAYRIRHDQISYVDYPGQLTGDPAAIVNDRATVPNARLLDPNVLSPTFTQQQQLRNFYGFPAQLAMDRYTVNGQTRDYVVAVRELNAGGLNDAQKNWINEHLVFTHGDGFVAAPATTVSDGYPAYTVSDISQQGDIPVTQPRTYYGEQSPAYAIVGAAGGVAREYDTDSSRYTYTGTGGVPVGNLFQRAVFATAYGEANFLFSSEINAELEDPVQPRPAGQGGQGCAVPDHRHHGLPGRRGRADRLDRRRLHHGHQLPVRAGGHAVGRDEQLARRPRCGRTGQDPGVLHPELGEGDRRRLRRHGHAVRRRRGRPGAAGVGAGVPRSGPPQLRCLAGPEVALPVPAGPVRGAAFAAGALPRRRPGGLLPKLRFLEGAERPDGERGRAGTAAPVLPAGQAARSGDVRVRADQCAHRVPTRIHERLPRGVLRPGATTGNSPCCDYPPRRRPPAPHRSNNCSARRRRSAAW